MWFGWLSVGHGGRIEPECDCFGVLRDCVECVMEVHEEGIALTAQMVLDLSVGEPCAVEYSN